MDFYSMLLAKNLNGSGGGGGGSVDPHESFKLYASGNLTTITAEMLDGVTEIRRYAFYNYDYLARVTIADSVTSIGNYAFCSCGELADLEIGENVAYIGAHAFENCYLAQVTIPNNVTRVGDGAFMACGNLEKVTIGSGITRIGNKVFLGSDYLISLTVLATIPPTLGSEQFSNFVKDDIVIYVPAESVNAYKAASGWSTYANQIQAIPS